MGANTMKNIVHALPQGLTAGIVTCLLACTAFHCVDTPLSPVAPMSDIKLEGISLVDITRTFADFLAKDSSFIKNTDGTSSFIRSESLTPQGIPQIKLQPQPSSQRVDVGQFGVAGFSKNTTVLASTISPSLSGPVPGVPAGSFPISAVSISDTSFDYVRIGSGTLTLTITNNMPVPIDFPGPITLRNNWTNPIDNSVIASFAIAGTMNPGASIPVPAVIDGKLLRGILTTDPFQLHTSGSASPVTFTSSSGITISIQSSTNLIADSALAVIPSQPVTAINDSVLMVDSLTVVQRAVLTKGLIILRIANNLGVDVGINLDVHELQQNGTNYIIHQTLAAKESKDFDLDFSKIIIQAEPPMRQYGTTVKFSVGISTLNSLGTKKVVTKNDFVQASFIPKDSLIVRTVVGKIKPTVVPINTGVASGMNGADLGNLSALVKLKGMELTVKLPITGGFPTDYRLAFIAKNSKNGMIDSIPFISSPGNIDFPRIDPTGGITSIHLGGDVFNNFVSKFFPEVPDSFFIRGFLTLDPADVFAQPNTVYTISDTTKIYPSFHLNLPVTMGIQDGVVREVLAFGKDQLPKDFTQHVSQGTLTFYFYNKFPVALNFRANFLGNYNPHTHKADTLLVIAPSTSIQAAAVDNDGNTTAPTFSKVSISLNNTQMIQFNNADSLYVRLDLSTSNNGQIVRLRDTDYIRIYAKGDISYTMGKQ
jgi:hypothetical protein